MKSPVRHPGRLLQERSWSSSSTMRQDGTSAQTGVWQNKCRRLSALRIQKNSDAASADGSLRTGEAVSSGCRALWLRCCVISTCGLTRVQLSGCCWCLLCTVLSGCECGSLWPDPRLHPLMSVNSGPAGSLRWRTAGYGNGLEHRDVLHFFQATEPLKWLSWAISKITFSGFLSFPPYFSISKWKWSHHILLFNQIIIFQYVTICKCTLQKKVCRLLFSQDK